MPPTATVILVEKLPDIVGKIYIVPKEIFNEYGEVKETVYEEWIFMADKIGEVSRDEFTEYEEWWEIDEKYKRRNNKESDPPSKME